MDRPVICDIALVILRLIFGIIFICHSWNRVFITGTDKTTGYFVAADIPQAHLTVWVVALVELVRGALLILGPLAPTMAMVFIIEMVGVWWLMHLGNGLFICGNDAELVMSLIGGLAMILVFGVGRFSSNKQFIR